MITLPFARDKTYGVVGLGKSGRATAARLLEAGAKVMAWDDGEKSRADAKQQFPALMVTPVAEWDFSAISALIMSPGILLSHPAVLAANKQDIEVIGDIELLYRAQAHARYVCITGTNGKSTTTTLIAHILKECGKKVEVGGNLGTPVLDLAPLGSDGIYVLELSSYQLDLVRTTHFQTAVLLNLSPDHIDHHGSMENYITAKRHIFDRMGEQDVAIIGVDDPLSEAICREMIGADQSLIIPISAAQGVDGGVHVENGILHNTLSETPMTADINSCRRLKGQHNWQNAAAAYAACLVNGCTHAGIIRAMQSYPGLAHRMEWLGEIGGVQFVNDSKATNADAAEKSLLTYDTIYWILGGVAKEGGIEPLAKYFPKVRHAFLIGEAAEAFAKTLHGKVEYSMCGTLEKAFHAAAIAAQKTAESKPTVLLAPACASFDQYPNFEVRGAAFVKLFEALKAGGTHGSSAA